MFSKPLVGALEGHIDAVYSLVKKPGVLNTIASGSGDGGELRPQDVVSMRNLTGCLLESRDHCARFADADQTASLPWRAQRRRVRDVLRGSGAASELWSRPDGQVVGCQDHI